MLACRVNPTCSSLSTAPPTPANAAQEGTFVNVNLQDWFKLIAASQKPVSDIWPGKFSK